MKNRKQKAFACTAAALSLALFGACSGGEYREKPLSENAVSLTANTAANIRINNTTLQIIWKIISPFRRIFSAARIRAGTRWFRPFPSPPLWR